MIQLINIETNVVVREFSCFTSALSWVQDCKNRRIVPTRWIIREGDKILRTSDLKETSYRKDKNAKYYKFWG
jgi:hypothetical protein